MGIHFQTPPGVNAVRLNYRYIFPPNEGLIGNQACLINLWAWGLSPAAYDYHPPDFQQDFLTCTVSTAFHVGSEFPGLSPGEAPPAGLMVGIRFFQGYNGPNGWVRVNNVAYDLGVKFVFSFSD